MANTIEVPLAHYKELAESHARLLEAARLAKVDIDYVLTAHPEITGLWVRNDAKKELDSAIAAAQQFTTEGEK
jgi:hypothetical protein